MKTRMISESSIALASGKKIYFASDFHLGAPDYTSSFARELKIIKWLEYVRKDASAIFLVGDIFDFWFEYKHAVPKGFIRFQGKLAELTDAGIEIVLFTGNHDLWYKEYFQKELNLKVYTQPIRVEIENKSFMIGHGDGLGKGGHLFKLVKKVFISRLPRWAFKWIHPDLGIPMARFWSGTSRKRSQKKDDIFLGEDEVLLNYCREVEQEAHHDYYIFGHRHLPLEMSVGTDATYFNLGEWFKANSYLEFDGEKASLLHFHD